MKVQSHWIYIWLVWYGIKLILTGTTFAEPRPPLPPFPERQLYSWRFDDPDWIIKPSSNALIAENLAFAESWSGYALNMNVRPAPLLVLPMLSGSPKPNLTANVGTVRFWFAPAWASASVGGRGPGDWARLLDIGIPSDTREAFWITLAASPDGNTLTLAARFGNEPAIFLQSPLQWNADAWHLVAVIYSDSATMLSVDGVVVASTANKITWPASREWARIAFAIGSALDGEESAHGQFEELTTYQYPLNPDYLAWQFQQLAPTAALGPVTDAEIAQRRMERQAMLTTSSAPSPPGGGGGGTNSPPYLPPSPPGLKLTQPIIAGSLLTTTLREADTNSAYDIFQKLGLQPTNKWSHAAMGGIGQTNFSLSVPSTNHAFYIAAAFIDSDFDGLPDAYEQLILGTSPLSADTNGDGIPDGSGDLNLNGLPDYVDYNGLTRAIVYASRTNAYEGGQAGEITIRLPISAPTNNTKITLHLGGSADYDGDYWMTKLNGARVTNDVLFAMGEREIRLQVHASNDLAQASNPRRVSATLAASANYPLDPNRADVNLVDNDLPKVFIAAHDAKAGEPKGTNVNPGLLVLRREGIITNALSVLLNVSGTATGGTDHTNITSPVIIPAGSNSVSIPVNPIHDTNYEGSETVVLTLQNNAAYVADSANATVTIADDDLPLVYLAGTDLVATEYNSLKAATVTLRRTGNTSQPLTVPLAISGTASNGVDYQTLGEMATFPANQSNVVINVRPLGDSLLEQAETVILTLKGSLQYNIGSSNSVTVHIDDDHATSFQKVIGLKTTSVYDPGQGIDSPRIVEVRRYGQSFQAANIGFRVLTNALTPTSFYHVSGDVSGTNAVFAPFATRARLKFRAPVVITQPNSAVSVQIPSINQELESVFFQRTWQYLRFSIVATNAVEGGSVQGRMRLSRTVTAPVNMSVQINVAGHAIPSGASGADHTLQSSFFMNLASNATFTETTFTANIDGTLEGWENIVFTPTHLSDDIVFDADVRYMGFVRENVANPETLPETDYDLDGLADRWELTHGLDPFTPGEELLDPDKDGLTNLDESQVNTNPNSGDSDGDGEADFSDLNRPADPGADYLAIRLQTRDTGKVNNGNNCAVCHTTELRAGDFSYFSPNRTNLTDKTFYFKKGTNYPIHLSELTRNLPRPNQDTGNPTTTGQYTANFLPATNQPRAFVVQDPQTRLGTNRAWSNFPTDPSVSIGSLIVPRIELTWEAAVGNAALETNPNEGGGLRIFPDALTPTASGFRNNVIVNVKTIPALPNQAIRLRSLDVDDPSSNTGGIIDTNDYFGFPTGNDNAGAPQAGQLAQTTLMLDSQGKAFTVFTVTTKPGDNFRIAAVLDTGADAISHLNALQTTNEFVDLYVGPDTNAITSFVGGISPMLTIWRKLHLEFDSMLAPPSTGPETIYISGTVVSIRTNFPAAGRSHVKVRHAIGSGPDNIYERGKLEITGGGTYAITNSHTSIIGSEFITLLEIGGVPPAVQAGTAVKLYDDDDRFLTSDPLYPSDLNLQSPPLPLNSRSAEFVQTNQARFAPAYIQLVDANALGWNTQSTISFKRHADAALVGGAFDAGNQQLKGTDRPEFWAYTVVFGYQSSSLDDGDPDTESSLDGITIKKGIAPNGYSVIYVEAIRDQVFGPVPNASFTVPLSVAGLRRSYHGEIYTTIVHELGHAPGDTSGISDHREGGLMKRDPTNSELLEFGPATVKRFRSAARWAE
ncbi:MAG: hypothetical protein L0Y58_14660 [Verrucomicrobia subdivision 3 bacterium]|nr:hypothetical protein [Limisphaerales bacterium]